MMFVLSYKVHQNLPISTKVNIRHAASDWLQYIHESVILFVIEIRSEVLNAVQIQFDFCLDARVMVVVRFLVAF